MYSPMMSQSVLSRGMLPYIPRAQPSPASRRKKAAAAAAAASSSEADGESLTKSTSKSSQTSSGGGGGEPSSSPRASLDAPLESDRPADAAAGVEPEHQHSRKHKRRSSKKQHDQDANHNNNNNNTTTSTAGSTGTTPGSQTQPAGGASADATPPPHPQHHSRHHSQQKPGPSASSSSSPPLPSAAAASPKPAPPPQHGAFKRASHSIIARAKHHDHHPLSLQTGPKHAHAHHNSSSTPRSPAAAVAHMNGNTVADIFAHAARNMSSSATTDASASASSRENLLTSKPFVLRNGRAYLNDTSLPYPLPADLTELHRQSMRTLLLIQVFGGPVCSPAFSKRPPQRVLEIGCGSGFWSMMCHRYFKSRGHGNISFTGIDIAPLAPTEPTTSNTTAASAVKPDPEMNWTFMSHDLRQLPWPMEDEHFDLVMVKDMSLATTNLQHQPFIDEYIRLLRPGGVLEIWESDHLIRMLRPHVPDTKLSGDDTEDQEAATSLGAYIMNANTPLSAPLNTFLVEYNQWLSRALEARDLTAVPCTLIGPTLLQESETLADVRSRRLAIPLSEVRWEREGVGGVVTKDGKPTAASSSKDRAPPKVESRVLSPGQEALRQTALLTVVQQVQALEPILREVSGKSQDEWDVWLGKMMGDLMSDGGTSWGECLEVGAWSATKRKR